MNIKIQKINKKAIMPTKPNKNAIGVDIYACTDSPIIITPHKSVVINTGLGVEAPEGYFCAVVARANTAYNKNITPAEKFCVLENNCKKEVKLTMHNDSDIPQTIMPMEQIAQMLCLPYLSFCISE